MTFTNLRASRRQTQCLYSLLYLQLANAWYIVHVQMMREEMIIAQGKNRYKQQKKAYIKSGPRKTNLAINVKKKSNHHAHAL